MSTRFRPRWATLWAAALSPFLMSMQSAPTLIRVDPSTTLVINGESGLARDRLFTMHSAGGANASRCIESAAAARHMWNPRSNATLSIPPGTSRSSLASAPLSASACSVPARPAPMKALSVGSYPVAISEPRFGESGTPADNKLAIDLLTQQLAAAGADQNLPFRFLEPRNESDVGANWGWHNEAGGWERNAQFHSEVARALRSRFPGLCVGGPTFAWPYFDRSEYRALTEGVGKFFEIAGKDLDFISLHAYMAKRGEEAAVPSKTVHERWGGTIAALRSCARKRSGRTLPVVITEYGQLLDAPASTDAELSFVRTTSALFALFSEMQESVALAVPFILPQAPWNSSYPYLACHWDGARPTKGSLHAFFDLLEPLQGDRVDLQLAGESQGGIKAVAFRHEQTVSILVTNETPATALVKPVISSVHGLQRFTVRQLKVSSTGISVQEQEADASAGVSVGPKDVVLLRAVLAGETPTRARRRISRDPIPVCASPASSNPQLDYTFRNDVAPSKSSVRMRLFLARAPGVFHPPVLQLASGDLVALNSAGQAPGSFPADGVLVGDIPARLVPRGITGRLIRGGGFTLIGGVMEVSDKPAE